MPEFTATQGRYLSFIQAYINLHGCPPSEQEVASALCVSPPSVNQMMKTLEKKGLILRQPGTPRSLQLLVPEEEIPDWRKGVAGRTQKPSRPGPSGSSAADASEPVKLYVLTVFLTGGPIEEKFANKKCSRQIEIRGDQTLEQLHHAIFQAYDRWDEHLFEFQFGRRPFDPDGPNYGMQIPGHTEPDYGDACTTTLDEVLADRERAFGYWFDFGDDWFHEVQIERIETAIPTVTYPRIGRRVGKSPPQYPDLDFVVERPRKKKRAKPKSRKPKTSGGKTGGRRPSGTA